MYKRSRDKHGAGTKSSQLTESTCQKTNRDNLSIYEFMRKIKSSFQILRAVKQECIGAGNLPGCNITSATGLQKKCLMCLLKSGEDQSQPVSHFLGSLNLDQSISGKYSGNQCFIFQQKCLCLPSPKAGMHVYVKVCRL